MVNSPYVSVIIPLYNKEDIVERSILSVLHQTFVNFELIVIDDGSTDNSLDVVMRIDDSRIVVSRKTNGGPASARNAGVQMAKGKYLVFLDADDEMLPDTLQIFWEYSMKQPVTDMLVGEYCTQKKGKRQNRKNIAEGYVNNAYIAHLHGLLVMLCGTTMYKTEFVKAHLFNEQIRRFEDYECQLRMFRHGKLYMFQKLVNVHNDDFASASTPRKEIGEDFLGHLNFSGVSFWEMMCNYWLFFQEHVNYEKQCRTLYPSLYWRFDLKIFSMFISRLNTVPLLRACWLKLIGFRIE